MNIRYLNIDHVSNLSDYNVSSPSVRTTYEGPENKINITLFNPMEIEVPATANKRFFVRFFDALVK
uniref:DUF223 domain-containing protein n=1 Tax=Heterorhabditis bacteriophora TaxID=37862 RepID=A0A1I7WKQ3_HETBA